MNHRVIFCLSILVIGVGIAGIFVQKNQPAVEKTPVETKVDMGRSIMVAQAMRDLSPYDILSPDDFKITEMKVSSDSNDSRDISSASNGNVRGYLVKNNVSKGSYLSLGVIEAPNSPTFARHSLQSDEMPYSFPIKPIDDYLLSSTYAGDKLSIYIRLTEDGKDKQSISEIVSASSANSGSGNVNKYVLNRIFSQVTVLESQRFEQDKKDKPKYTNDSIPVGVIVVRLNQRQLAELRVVEKAGDVLLLPENGAEPAVVNMRVAEVLPQTRSIKELRGTK